ncbi:MAG: TetR family transcriptional regulator [Alphaproteobacteria bacterium]
MKAKKTKPRKVGAKGAETRRLLIEAATKLFRAKGIGATSLDEIAAEAGVTKGAIYDHFSGKNDLVFELFSAHGNPLLQAFKAGLSAREQKAALRDFLVASIPARPDYISSNFEANQYLANNPDLAQRFAGFAEAGLTEIADRLAASVPASDRALTPLELTIALSSLHTGLLFHRMVTPSLVSDTMMRNIYNALLGLADETKPKRARKRKAT